MRYILAKSHPQDKEQKRLVCMPSLTSLHCIALHNATICRILSSVVRQTLAYRLKPPQYLTGTGDYIMRFKMATSIRLDDDFVEEVKVHAEAMSRSVPKQIEYWAKIGRIAEDNPDLPFSFINEILLAKSEMDNGRMKKYVRRKDRTGN